MRRTVFLLVMGFAACLLAAFTPDAARAEMTYFAYDSAPASWVGQGRTGYFVSPETGWTFSAGRNFDNGVSFSIRRNDGPPPIDNYYWTLNLAAPFDALLVPGLYTDATRWPFQSPSSPGLDLAGNHRGNNTLTGSFEVLEAVYGDGGRVERFSVNFTQYDEGRADWWIVGQLRYNATEPGAVPEPSSAVLALTGLAALWLRRRGFRRQCTLS